MSLAGIFRSALTLISPTLNTRVTYFFKTGKRLNLTHPAGLREKLLKLKLENYNHSPLVRQCADKYAVRRYVREKIPQRGQQLLNDLISVYDDPSEIDWEQLPECFVIKWNFGCGMNLIVPDKSALDLKAAVRTLKKWGRSRPYLGYSEMQYKGVPKKLLVEKFLSGKNGALPEDYKLYCFNGTVRAVLVIQERQGVHTRAGFFDPDWNYLGRPKKSVYQELGPLPEKPESLPVMLETAAALSADFPFVRVDFYEVDKKAVFGEMTFTPAAGHDVFEIDLNGRPMGDFLDLLMG